MERRTLRISKSFAGFEYKYCIKKSFFKKKCKKWQVDKYDLTDPVMREKLINIGFRARVLDDIY